MSPIPTSPAGRTYKVRVRHSSATRRQAPSPAPVAPTDDTGQRFYQPPQAHNHLPDVRQSISLSKKSQDLQMSISFSKTMGNQK